MKEIVIGSARLKYAFTPSMAQNDNKGGCPDQIIQAIGESPSLPVELTNALIGYLEEKVKRVGVITSVLVDKESRGQGLGKQLVQQYMDAVGKATEIDILIASVGVRQKEGFSLVKFYEGFGFKPVVESDGELLMVTKDHGQAILKYIALQYSPRLTF